MTIVCAVLWLQLELGCASFASAMFLLSQCPFLLPHVDGGQNLVGKLSHLPSLLFCAYSPCLPAMLCYSGAAVSAKMILVFYLHFLFIFK